MDKLEICETLASGRLPDFGVEGASLEFIRGQDDIAIYEGVGTGRRLSITEAYETFSPEIFAEILEYGSAQISKEGEPAASLKKQLAALDGSREALARAAAIPMSIIREIELGETESDFKHIAHLCKFLSVNDYNITSGKHSANHKLAVRLKENWEGGEITDDDIFKLARCGWIADRQLQLEKWLNAYNPLSTTKNSDYGSPEYPAFKIGYELAHKARRLLDIAPGEPIPSMVELCRKIGIPYIQTHLSRGIAGATVATNNSRCIVINIEGRNENPWRRRITVAHELEHLLWDSDENLKSLNINQYDNTEIYDPDGKRWIEQRANAFAVEFLLPSAYIAPKKYTETIDGYIRKIMVKYGVSFTSAKQHLRLNGIISEEDEAGLNELAVNTEATDEWKGRENFTVDYFPVKNVPDDMRGRFAWWVCEAYKKGVISLDSASNFLECDAKELENNAETILEILG